VIHVQSHRAVGVGSSGTRRQAGPGPDQEWLESCCESDAGLVGVRASRYSRRESLVDGAGSSAACPGARSVALVMYDDSPCTSTELVNPASTRAATRRAGLTAATARCSGLDVSQSRPTHRPFGTRLDVLNPGAPTWRAKAWPGAPTSAPQTAGVASSQNSAIGQGGRSAEHRRGASLASTSEPRSGDKRETAL